MNLSNFLRLLFLSDRRPYHVSFAFCQHSLVSIRMEKEEASFASWKTFLILFQLEKNIIEVGAQGELEE